MWVGWGLIMLQINFCVFYLILLIDLTEEWVFCEVDVNPRKMNKWNSRSIPNWEHCTRYLFPFCSFWFRARSQRQCAFCIHFYRSHWLCTNHIQLQCYSLPRNHVNTYIFLPCKPLPVSILYDIVAAVTKQEQSPPCPFLDALQSATDALCEQTLKHYPNCPPANAIVT